MWIQYIFRFINNNFRFILLTGLFCICIKGCLNSSNDKDKDAEFSLDSIRINEVVANSATNEPDWVELFIGGDKAVQLSHYSIVDGNMSHDLTSLPDTSLEPGEYFVIEAQKQSSGQPGGVLPYNLGNEDAVFIFYQDKIVDSLSWTEESVKRGISYGRFPDGADDFSRLRPTKGSGNKKLKKEDFPENILEKGKADSLFINEVMATPDSGGNDWFELYAAGSQKINLSNYTVVDNNKNRSPQPLPDTVLKSGEFIVILAQDSKSDAPQVPFKLGANDKLTLYYRGEKVNSLKWSSENTKMGASFGYLPIDDTTLYLLSPTPGKSNVKLDTSAAALLTFDSLFDETVVRKVRIGLSPGAWKSILDDPAAEAYKTGTISFDGHAIKDVAIRTKGNSSLNAVIRSGSHRLSFKVDFNMNVKGQAVGGVKKLNFNNGFKDPTLIREALGYGLMREAGLPTPRFAFVDLWLNDEHLGLYTMVEQVDDFFLKRHFSNYTGDLYKPQLFSGNLKWLGDSIDHYPGMSLRTNESNSTHGALMEFLRILNLDTSVSLDSVLKVDQVIRYIAVNTLLVNLDSYNGSGHNYYLYEDDGVFSIIPWDLNEAFGNFTCSCDRSDLLIFHIDEPTCGAVAGKPLIARIFKDSALHSSYHRHLEKLMDTAFSVGKMEQKIKRYAELIREHVKDDSTKFYSTEEFEKGLGLSNESLPDDDKAAIPLLLFVKERSKAVSAQLKGEKAASINGDGACPDASGPKTGEPKGPAPGKPPVGNPCGDGVCDAFEKENPDICPQDCS